MNFTLLKAELYHNRSRTLFNIILIAIAVTVVIVFNTFTYSYRISMEKPFQEIGTNIIIQKKRTQPGKQIPVSMMGIQIPFSSGLISKYQLD